MAPRERLVANGHSRDLTPDAIQARIKQTQDTMKTLLAERQAIALASVAGDTTASSRIAAIDRERASLECVLLTLTDAKRALHDKERVVEWRKFLPKARAIFAYEFSQQAEVWPDRIRRLLIGRQSHDLTALANALAELEDLERTTAQLAASRALPDHLFRTSHIAGQGGHDRADSHRRNAEARAKMEELVVNELLANTSDLRRPRALEQALVDARHRLAIEAGNGKTFQRAARVVSNDMSFIGRARG